MDNLLYDDTYTGRRWRYGLVYRPLTAASAPKGWIIFSLKKSQQYPYGTVDFPRPLTEDEVTGYQLEPEGEVARFIGRGAEMPQ